MVGLEKEMTHFGGDALGKEDTMKAAKIVLILAFGVFLAVPTKAFGVIRDPNPDNLSGSAYYDYRDYGAWASQVGVGAESSSGAYFLIDASVRLGGFLVDFKDVISIEAKHIQTKRRFFLAPGSCTTWLGDDEQFWGLFFRPVNWMLEGTWKFIMYYNGSDNEKHLQVIKRKMGTVVFPLKPSNIKAVKQQEQGSIMLSWSGIGDPGPDMYPFNYRVRIYEDGCVVAELRMGTDGSYDPYLHKVIFTVPIEWSGHIIRLENRIATDQFNRAMQYLRLP